MLSRVIPILLRRQSSKFVYKNVLRSSWHAQAFPRTIRPFTTNIPNLANNQESVTDQDSVKKLQLSATCKKCGTRNTKIISKVAYENGKILYKYLPFLNLINKLFFCRYRTNTM